MGEVGAGVSPAVYPGAPGTVAAALADGRVLVRPRWGIGDVLITFAGMVVVAVATAFGLDALAAAGVELSFGAETVVGLVAPWVALAGWPVVATRWKGNGPRIDLGIRMGWPDVRAGAVGGVIALVIVGIGAIVLVALFGGLDSSAGVAAAELTERGGRLWVLVFGLLLFTAGPFVEELAFRGLLFSSLRKAGVGSWTTILVSAALFALVHFEPSRLVILFAAGVVFGVLRDRTGAIGAPIVAHAMLNAPGAILTMAGLAGVTP